LEIPLRNLGIDEEAAAEDQITWPKGPVGSGAPWRETSLIPTLCMLGVLIVGGYMRFAQLGQRGLLYWDEAKFALEGERMQAYLGAWFGLPTHLTIGKAIGTAKPMHAVLLGVGYAIFGIHDYAALYTDAFFSLLTIAVVYFIGRRIFGPWAAVISALFFAVSAYDVIYARSALSESDAGFFLAVAVLLWFIDWEKVRAADIINGAPSRYLIASALLGSLAITVNYRMIIYVFTLALFDVAWTWSEIGGVLPNIRRLVSWVAGVAALPVMWEVLDAVARVANVNLFRWEVNTPASGLWCGQTVRGHPTTYFQQLWFQLHCGKQGATGFDPLRYLQWFQAREGWLTCALVLVGFWVSIRTHLFPWAALMALVVLPFLFYCFAPFIVPRNLAQIIPYASILAGGGLVAFGERLPSDALRRMALVAIGSAVAIVGAFQTYQIARERSGLARAAAYVGHHSDFVLGTNEITRFYFPGKPTGTSCHARSIPVLVKDLFADVADGYQYAILQANRSEGPPTKTPAIKYMLDHWQQVAVYPAFGQVHIGENPVASENGYPPGTFPHSRILVYHYAGPVLPSGPVPQQSLCWRNRTM
jgi:4-amino-4-deoxy-L-arabinose transferase-like glycosyltransferase